MKTLDNYYINRATCVIVPIEKNLCEVHEQDDVFLVSKSSKEIVDDSCRYYGSSYQGRFEGAKKILNMNYKLPIIIEEFHDLIFFPTNSPRVSDCIWISLSNIVSYDANDKGSKISFRGDTTMDLDISYYSLENQIFRATMLDHLIRKRRNS